MGIAYCDKCDRVIDLDTHLEDFNFKTCLCIDCERKEGRKEDEYKPGHHPRQRHSTPPRMPMTEWDKYETDIKKGKEK